MEDSVLPVCRICHLPFGRQLTQEETNRLCELTGLPKNYGSY
jgi:cytochrome c553